MADLVPKVMSAFWEITLNNPTASERILIERGYEEHMRELIWTMEEGENGTPHIQAFCKLHRQHRKSFMIKLFPRADLRLLASDEYVFNVRRYAQKQDHTARGPSRHLFNALPPTIESTIKLVVKRMYDEHSDFMIEITSRSYVPDALRERFNTLRLIEERELVEGNLALARIFISAQYEKMWDRFGVSLVNAVDRQSENEDRNSTISDAASTISTHTHTHTHNSNDLRKFFSKEKHNNAPIDPPSPTPYASEEEQSDEETS